MRFRITLAAMPVLACGLFAAAGPALAQSGAYAQDMLNDKFNISVGGFIVGTDVKGELNGRATGGQQEVDFGKDFGLDNDATRVRLDGLWRITPRHRLRFMYFDTQNDGARTLDRTINWGDYTFNVGARVTAETRIRIAELAYEYAFSRQPAYEIAGTIGVHYLDTQVKLTGAASITDGNGVVTSAGAVTRENSVPAPLPVIGLRGNWAVAPKFLVDAHAQFFWAEVQGYDGTITDARLAGTWMFARNFGVGLGYNYFGVDVDVDKSSFNGTLKVGYSGLQLFVTGTF
jgi:hypothetical protein